MLEVGKLYTCEKYHLMLYPDPDIAAATCGAEAAAAGASTSAAAGDAAAYWSNRFGKPVFSVDKNVPILALSSKTGYIEVLAGDRKGWIIFKDWLKIKKIDHA